MTHVILFDSEVRDYLLPLTFVRPVAELRIGLLTIREKWKHLRPAAQIGYLTQDYLSAKYPLHYGDDNLLVNGSVVPTPELLQLLQTMETGQAYVVGEELIATRLDGERMAGLIDEEGRLDDEEFGELETFDLQYDDLLKINRPYDIFSKNDQALQLDFELLTANRRSAPLPASNRLIGPADRLFIAEGASIEACTLNTTTGPIYIGTGAQVMEGCLLRGSLAIGEQAILKMGTRIYGPTTVGPFCKVGGEINNTVFFAHSNKAHDGYLGNAVLAEWCNIGADTNSSNLKNTYDEVRIWSYPEERFVGTGLQFCGLIMGDHSKAGINTMFNTGTVVGVSANIFGSGFPRQFIPSFSWGGASGFTTYKTDKAFDTMRAVMQRRELPLTQEEQQILKRVYADTAKYRRWEKT